MSRASAPETYTSDSARSALFGELVRLFHCLRGTGPVAVLADDVHAAPNPELAVAAAHQAGCTVVATCREDGITAGPMALSAVAGRVLDLAPLADDEIGELLAAAAMGQLDASVAPALRAGLGSLAGNPGTVLGTFEKLVRERRFIEVQGHLCLADPATPIALPRDHYLVRHVARFGEPAAQLVGLVDGMDRFSVDDLVTFAAATERDLGSCGRMVDELAAVGVLDYDSDGVLTVPCPALSAAVLDEFCPSGMASVHHTIAKYLVRGDSAFLVEPAMMADHIALAGVDLPPDKGVVALLESEASRVLHARPIAATRWYRAALRHCPPGDADHGRILGIVTRLLIRVGHYRCLGEVVAEAVAVGFEAGMHYSLAVSAALAAVHIGAPVPDAVRAALSADSPDGAPIEFAAAWFGGRVAFGSEEVEPVFGAFRGEPSLCEERIEAVEMADDRHDVLTLLKVVLGAGYGEPDFGPIAIFGRIAQNFAKGDWSGIPSDARQLELAGSTGTALHQMARLIAAEVLSSFGDLDGASRWLETVNVNSQFPAVRIWVKIGIAYRSEDWDEAREQGWAAYEKIAANADNGDHVGLRWFLIRLAYLEKQAGNSENLRILCEDTKRWHERSSRKAHLRVAELILRGLAEDDFAAATEAVEILRKQDNQSELMRALITVAFTAEEPRPWYHEAYDIARRLGGDWMRTNVKASMRSSGVDAPSARSGQERLTPTDEEIIGMIKHGLTNRQIAATMQVSEKTVENYLTRLFAKTDCRSRLDLAMASLEGRLSVGPYLAGH